MDQRQNRNRVNELLALVGLDAGRFGERYPASCQADSVKGSAWRERLLRSRRYCCWMSHSERLTRSRAPACKKNLSV